MKKGKLLIVPLVMLSALVMMSSFVLADVECYTNNDCGNRSYWLGEPYCAEFDNNVYDTLKTPWCLYPGTNISQCVTLSGDVVYEECTLNACQNATCAVECNEADVNADMTVSGTDYNLVYNNWGMQGCNSTNSWCDWTDITRDTFVGGSDLSIVMTNWGQTTGFCVKV